MTTSQDIGDRSYRSIGEVLAEVQDEFPEITISKIRFLESQGLIDPERTASGYRKFYARDVERLRFILRSQKDAYLPLKVIKDRLSQHDGVAVMSRAEITEPLPVTAADSPANGTAADSPAPVIAADAPANGTAANPVHVAGIVESVAFEAITTGKDEVPAPERVPLWMRPKPTPATPVVAPAATSVVAPLGVETGVSMTFDELAGAAGLTATQLREIESFGLIASTAIGRERLYDEDALLVTKLVASFVAQGLEPRHLRMYRTSVDREAGLFEQVAAPLVKQRNPEARAEAQRRLDALGDLGEQMRAALLRRALRPYNVNASPVT